MSYQRNFPVLNKEQQTDRDFFKKYDFIGSNNGCPYKSKDTCKKNNDRQWSFEITTKKKKLVRVYKSCANVPDNYCKELHIPFAKNGFILTGHRVGYYNENCLTVIDFDKKKDGMLDYVISLIPPKYQETLMIETGSGGLHLFYEVVGNVASKKFESDKLNDSHHLEFLKGVDTRGNGGKLFAVGSKFVEHPHEYRFYKKKLPMQITEEEFFAIFIRFVDKDTYDNLLHCKKGKKVEDIKSGHLNNPNKKEVNIWYEHLFGTYSDTGKFQWDGLMLPTKDFWTGLYQIQSGHNNQEFIYWKILLGDLMAHGYDIEDIVDHFEGDMKLQPEFKSVETYAQVSAPSHQDMFEMIRERVLQQMDTSETLPIPESMYEKYFPEYFEREPKKEPKKQYPQEKQQEPKKKDSKSLPKDSDFPSDSETELKEEPEEENIDNQKVIPRNSLVSIINEHKKKHKSKLDEFIHSDKILGYCTSQVGTKKTQMLKEYIIEKIKNNELETVFWFVPLRKALPLKYVREDLKDNSNLWMEILPKVYTEEFDGKKETKCLCKLAEPDLAKEILKAVLTKNPLLTPDKAKEVVEIMPYFFGCIIKSEIYNNLQDLFDPNEDYSPIKINDENYHQCPYREICAWMKQKKRILSNFKDGVKPTTRLFFTTVQQFDLWHEILNNEAHNSPELYVFDENFLSWWMINYDIKETKKWIEVKNNNKKETNLYQYTGEQPPLISGSTRLTYYDAGNQGNVQLWFDHIEIDFDRLWECNTRNYENPKQLYELSLLKGCDLYGYIYPPFTLMKKEVWQKAYEDKNTHILTDLLYNEGIFHLYGRKHLKIETNKVVFACATTPSNIVKTMFDITNENDYSLMIPENAECRNDFIPNPKIFVNTRSLQEIMKDKDNDIDDSDENEDEIKYLKDKDNHIKTNNDIQWGIEKVKKIINKYILPILEKTRTKYPLIIVRKDIENLKTFQQTVKILFNKSNIIHYGDAIGRNDCFYEELDDDECIDGKIQKKRDYIDSIIVIGRFGYNNLQKNMLLSLGFKADEINDLEKGSIIQAIGRGRFMELSDIPIWLFCDRDIIKKLDYDKILLKKSESEQQTYIKNNPIILTPWIEISFNIIRKVMKNENSLTDLYLANRNDFIRKIKGNNNNNRIGIRTENIQKAKSFIEFLYKYLWKIPLPQKTKGGRPKKLSTKIVNEILGTIPNIRR